MKLSIEEEADKLVDQVIDGTWEGLERTKADSDEGNDQPVPAIAPQPKRWLSQRQLGLGKSFLSKRRRSGR